MHTYIHLPTHTLMYICTNKHVHIWTYTHIYILIIKQMHLARLIQTVRLLIG